MPQPVLDERFKLRRRSISLRSFGAVRVNDCLDGLLGNRFHDSSIFSLSWSVSHTPSIICDVTAEDRHVHHDVLAPAVQCHKQSHRAPCALLWRQKSLPTSSVLQFLLDPKVFPRPDGIYEPSGIFWMLPVPRVPPQMRCWNQPGSFHWAPSLCSSSSSCPSGGWVLNRELHIESCIVMIFCPHPRPPLASLAPSPPHPRMLQHNQMTKPSNLTWKTSLLGFCQITAELTNVSLQFQREYH